MILRYITCPECHRRLRVYRVPKGRPRLPRHLHTYGEHCRLSMSLVCEVAVPERQPFAVWKDGVGAVAHFLTLSEAREAAREMNKRPGPLHYAGPSSGNFARMTYSVEAVLKRKREPLGLARGGGVWQGTQGGGTKGANGMKDIPLNTPGSKSGGEGDEPLDPRGPLHYAGPASGQFTLIPYYIPEHLDEQPLMKGAEEWQRGEARAVVCGRWLRVRA